MLPAQRRAGAPGARSFSQRQARQESGGVWVTRLYTEARSPAWPGGITKERLCCRRESRETMARPPNTPPGLDLPRTRSVAPVSPVWWDECYWILGSSRAQYSEDPAEVGSQIAHGVSRIGSDGRKEPTTMLLSWTPPPTLHSIRTFTCLSSRSKVESSIGLTYLAVILPFE